MEKGKVFLITETADICCLPTCIPLTAACFLPLTVWMTPFHN